MTSELPFWYGEMCLIIGGGPSINDIDRSEIQAWPYRTIAINEAGLSVDPYADILYWCDMQWGKWNRDRYEMNNSRFRMTSAQGNIGDFPRTQYVHTDTSKDFWTDVPEGQRPTVSGCDSGTRCINLAYLCGANTVFLIGFDMHDTEGKGNFHDLHQQVPPKLVRSRNFVPAHEKMSRALPRGFQVFNCTPNSALKCYPAMEWSKIK